MTTICLIRHGQTDWNKTGRLQGQENTPMNEEGIEQAKRCAAYIKNEPWDVLYSSPLDRARDTASFIGKETGLSDILVEELLIERCFGEASGLTLPERRAKYPEGAEIPGWETRDEIVKRASEVITKIAQQNSGKRVLIVAHGGIINAMLYHVSGGTIGTGFTILENTSITRLTYEGGSWTLQSYNECAC